MASFVDHVIVAAHDIEIQFEIDRAIAETDKAGSDKDRFVFFHDFFEKRRNSAGLVRIGLVNHTNAKARSPSRQASHIDDFLVEQIGVGNDDFFTGSCSQPSAFQANFLDCSDGIVIGDCLSPTERLVENNRKRRKKVGKNALSGKTDGDAAHPETRNQAGDIDTQIIKNHDRRDCKEHERDQQTDQGHRVFQRFVLVRILRGLADDQPENYFTKPDRHLNHHRYRKQDMDNAIKAGRRICKTDDELGRHHHHEKLAGTGNRRTDDRAIAGQALIVPDIAGSETLDCTERKENCGANDNRDDQFHITGGQPVGAVHGHPLDRCPDIRRGRYKGGFSCFCHKLSAREKSPE